MDTGTQTMTTQKEHWKDALKRTFDAWNGKHVITSPDVDGLLCARLVLDRYPKAQLIGVYDTKRLVMFGAQTTWKDAREALWVDLDVLCNVLCIGQHLIQKEPSDQLPTRHPFSFNPNVHYEQPYWDSFKAGQAGTRDKYPFGTVHFLMDYFGITDAATYAWPLIAHADGAWINAVKYADNCNRWSNEMFTDSVLERLLNYTEYPEHLETHTCTVEQLQRLIGTCMGHSRTNCTADEQRLLSSKWLALKGNQSIECRGEDHETWIDRFKRVWDYVGTETMWAPKAAVDFTIGLHQTGIVRSITHFPLRDEHGRFYPAPKVFQTLDTFTVIEEVFSFAITFRNTLRFTRKIDLQWQEQSTCTGKKRKAVVVPPPTVFQGGGKEGNSDGKSAPKRAK